MATLANLIVFLGLDSAKFSAGLDDATKKSQNFAREQNRIAAQSKANADAMLSRLGTIAIGLVGIQGLLRTFEKADQLQDLAGAFDTTAGAVLQTGKALEIVGGKADDVAKLWSKLAVSQQGAIEGSDKLRNAFAEIGVSAKEVQALSPDELFQRVAEQLATIENPTLRNAKAFELLGKAAKGIDWKEYVKEYKGVADPDLNEALNEAATAWDNIQKGVQGTFEIIIKLIQPIAWVVNHLARLKQTYNDLKKNGGEVNFDPDNPFSGATITGKAAPVDPRIAKAEEDRKKAISDKLKNARDGYTIESPEDAAVRAANEQSRIQARIFETEKARLVLANQRVFATAYEGKVQDEILKSNDTIAKLEEQRSKVSSQIKYGNEEAKRSKQIEVNNLTKQIDYEKELNTIRLKNLADEEARINSFEFGWDQAYKKLIENNDKASLKAAQVFATLESGFDQLLDVITGKSKRSFTELTLSILQDLVKIELKAQAVAALKSAGGFGGIGAAIGGFFGFGGGGGGIDPAYNFAGYADGGDPPVNRPSLVGENGPELFTPKTAGTITPNNQLGMSATTNYYGPVISNLNAIDTQSGLQFLIKNKEAVYAANQSAQRSLPVSR